MGLPTAVFFIAALAPAMAGQPDVPRDSRQAVEPTPDLTRGIQQVVEGDLETGLATLERVVKTLHSDPARTKDMAQAYLYMGMASTLLGLEAAGKGHFREALRQDSGIRLKADDYPAKCVRAFEAARLEAVASGLLPAATQVSQESAPVPPAPTKAPIPVSPPNELYTRAYASYARGMYDAAVQAFGEYLRAYPKTELSDNAQYWIGESLFAAKQYQDAIEAWRTLISDFPASDRLPDARLKIGLALQNLGQRSQAFIAYRYVVDHYPNSPAARRARELLSR